MENRSSRETLGLFEAIQPKHRGSRAYGVHNARRMKLCLCRLQQRFTVPAMAVILSPVGDFGDTKMLGDYTLHALRF